MFPVIAMSPAFTKLSKPKPDKKAAKSDVVKRTDNVVKEAITAPVTKRRLSPLTMASVCNRQASFVG